MDFLVIKSRGHGIQTMITEALKTQGTQVILDMGRQESLGLDLGQQIEAKVQETGGKPLTVLIDISDVESEPYMMLDIVCNRRIGGTPLPGKSSIIIAMNEPGPYMGNLIPAPLAARTVRLDLNTPGFNAVPGVEISAEGLAKLRERTQDAVLNMISVIHDIQGLAVDQKRHTADPDAPNLN